MTEERLPHPPAIMMSDGPEEWSALLIKPQHDMVDFMTNRACATIPALVGTVSSKEAEERLRRMFDNRAVVGRNAHGNRIVKVACEDVDVLERIQAAAQSCDGVLTTRAILWAMNPDDYSHLEPKAIRNVREGVARLLPDDLPGPVNVMSIPSAPDVDALITAMTGPERGGNHVIVDGRLVPNLAMRDAGAQIEFVLDSRVMFSFPREWAYLAASFAFHAMAIGAGFGGPGGLHESARAFGVECSKIEAEDS